jgi:hypothetical protein
LPATRKAARRALLLPERFPPGVRSSGSSTYCFAVSLGHDSELRWSRLAMIPLTRARLERHPSSLPRPPAGRFEVASSCHTFIVIPLGSSRALRAS